MSVEFEIEFTKKDYYNYVFFDFLTTIGSHIFSILIWSMIIIAIAIGLYIYGFKVILAGLIFLAIWLIIIGIVLKLHGWINLANKLVDDGFNKFNLFLEEDKFSVEDRIQKDNYKATAIIEGAITKSYVLLYMSKQKHVAWILPKSQLSESQYNDIISFLNNNNITIKNYSWC